jgi:predicted nucleic acid-binding protein
LSKKPERAYLDSMVFIFGKLEECNSRLVLFLAQLGEFEVVTSELILEEVERFFRENFSREAGYLARKYVEELSFRIIKRSDINAEKSLLRGKIKGKDLENVAAVKHENLKYLVAYDKDYGEAGVKEYINPKEFVKLFNLKPYDKEY